GVVGGAATDRSRLATARPGQWRSGNHRPAPSSWQRSIDAPNFFLATPARHNVCSGAPRSPRPVRSGRRRRPAAPERRALDLRESDSTSRPHRQQRLHPAHAARSVVAKAGSWSTPGSTVEEKITLRVANPTGMKGGHREYLGDSHSEPPFGPVRKGPGQAALVDSPKCAAIREFMLFRGPQTQRKGGSP